LIVQVSTIPKLKCRCGAVVVIQTCPKTTSVRIAIPDDIDTHTPIWLTVFSNEINIMLAHYDDNLSPSSSEDDITTALLSLNNITIEYDTETNIVKAVTF